MTYKIKTTPDFDKQIKKLDNSTRMQISKWIEKHLYGTKDPRAYGKALKYDMYGLWRYRIGDYRLICEINDNELIILAVDIEHRRDVYD